MENKPIKFVGKALLINEAGEKKERILVIGDLHLGYEEGLREAGVMVPLEMYKQMREELDLVFAKTEKVDKIIVLGDLKHEFGKILGEEWSGALGIFDYLSTTFLRKKSSRSQKNYNNGSGEIIIVKGNHDKIIEPIAAKRNVRVVGFLIIGEYAFVHGDYEFKEILDKGIRVWVMGHAHPAIVLSEKSGVKKEKYKCFLSGKWKGREIIILPSFFPLSEGVEVNGMKDGRDLGLAWDFDLSGFKVGVVEEADVLDFGGLGDLEK